MMMMMPHNVICRVAFLGERVERDGRRDVDYFKFVSRLLLHSRKHGVVGVAFVLRISDYESSHAQLGPGIRRKVLER